MRIEDLKKINKNISQLQEPVVSSMEMPLGDNRTRAEKREDFDRDLAELDKDALIELLNSIKTIDKYSDNHKKTLWGYKEDLENIVTKLIRLIDQFDDLNSEESRKVALKIHELKLEAKHDWADKFRAFFFRVLASLLFICTLFGIGYLEKEYEWATLPLSKYIKPIQNSPVQ